MARHPRWPIVIALACGCLVAGGCAGDDRRERQELQGGAVTEGVLAYVSGIPGADAGYDAPDEAERSAVVRAWRFLERGRLDDARAVARRHGYEVERLDDGVHALWGPGGYFVHRRQGDAVVVQVPHPVADARTETLGAVLAERTGARALLVAGSHREAGDGRRADVAHAPGTVFDAVHRAAIGERDVVVQVHGYADRSAPGTEVVVSRGAEPSELTDDVAQSLDGFAVCRWKPGETRCGDLAGTQNRQGVQARALGAEFLHIEVNRTVRDDDRRASALLRALAEALRSSGGRSRP